jgi:hypothetical protein
MARPRAADDFVVIRARMIELQRQHNEAVRGVDAEPSAGPKSAALAQYQLKLLRDRQRFTR